MPQNGSHFLSAQLFAVVMASFTPNSKRYASPRPTVSAFGLCSAQAASGPRQAGQEVTSINTTESG